VYDNEFGSGALPISDVQRSAPDPSPRWRGRAVFGMTHTKVNAKGRKRHSGGPRECQICIDNDVCNAQYLGVMVALLLKVAQHSGNKGPVTVENLCKGKTKTEGNFSWQPRRRLRKRKRNTKRELTRKTLGLRASKRSTSCEAFSLGGTVGSALPARVFGTFGL
jgi:hypothetical protein